MPDEPDWKPPPASLNPEGQLEGQPAPGGLPLIDGPAPTPADQPLELAERPPPKAWEEPGPYREEPPDPRRRRAAILAIAAVAVGLVLLVAGLLVSRYSPGTRAPRFLEKVLAAGSAPPLIVDSEPGGADVIVDGTVIGQTPWAGDNRWTGEVALEVRKKGYLPWRKNFTGREETHLTAKLKAE